MKKYELTQYEFVKVRIDHKPFWQMCDSIIKMQIYDQPRCFIRSVFSVSMEKVGLVVFFFFFFFFLFFDL